MFGYDFAADHAALAGGDAPRVDTNEPAESLILNKPTSEDEHGGGLRYEHGGWEYHLLKRWIEAGAVNDSAAAGKLAALDVEPREIVFTGDGEKFTLRALARWSDGTIEDVTCLTRFATNDESVATVTPEGVVESAGAGSTFVIASYDSGVTATQVLRPVSNVTGPRFPEIASSTRIDELVVSQLRKLGIVPSEQAEDAEFLRRVSLDITGSLPTPDEVLAFLADPAPDKRLRKIDELLDRPAYVMWWTTKLCDLVGHNGNGQLGTTEIAKAAGEQWQRWIEHRVRTNAGYDEIARGILLATSRLPGETYMDYVEAMTSYLRKVDQVEFAEQEMMPYYWFRANLREPQDKALAVAYSFLGVRLECAQCHKHPFDQWSQQDFQQFTAFFDRVTVGYAADAEESRRKLEEAVGLAGFKNAAERRQTYRRLTEAGTVIVPFREVYIAPAAESDSDLPPKPLGADAPRLAPDDDPRRALVDWMLRRENPYFAKAFVNRVWAHYFGVGIVDPPDDFNLANPPSNAALLDLLADEFVDHGYDMRWLHRTITSSDTYQRSWKPNDTNRLDVRHFSHALPRRLPAEVMVDAIHQATAGGRSLATAHVDLVGRRIGEPPPAALRGMEYALAVFGKPLRLTNCDCERQSDPSLQQAIFLRNDNDLWTEIDRGDGWLHEAGLAARPETLVHEAYLRTVGRLPSTKEIDRSVDHLSAAGDVSRGLRDLVWALLNTQEFMTNH